MTQVTFFLHDQTTSAGHPAHLISACHLATQCYSRKQRCVVLCEDQSQAEQFDELLWQQPSDRFVPHNLQGEGPAKGTPVEIAWQMQQGPARPVLINLSPTMPDTAGRFKLVYDFVPAQDDLKQQARERYKHYRAAGFPLETQPANSITESQDG